VGLLQASDGPFTIVERSEDLLWRPDAPADLRASVAARLVPVRVAHQPDGTWTSECTLIYAGVLFKAKLSVAAGGIVEMTDDAPLTEELPVSMERMVGVVKVLRQMSDLTDERLAEARNNVQQAPYDPEPLRVLATMYGTLNRWKDATEPRRKAIELLRSDKDALTVDFKLQALKEAYRDLAHDQLRARDFAGALATVAATPKLEPQDLELQLERAHALLFLGRYQEAEAAYRAHIGQSIAPGPNSATWQSRALKDLDEFEKAGITNADVAKIKKLLAT
jgi:tetratricopeptide (TPR) repeat protein